MPDIIDQLLGMDDATLSSKIGQDRTLAKFKKDLSEAAQLPPKLRAEAAERIDRAVNPPPSPSEIGWIVDDLQREHRNAGQKGAVAEMTDASPASLSPE